MTETKTQPAEPMVAMLYAQPFRTIIKSFSALFEQAIIEVSDRGWKALMVDPSQSLWGRWEFVEAAFTEMDCGNVKRFVLDLVQMKKALAMTEPDTIVMISVQCETGAVTCGYICGNDTAIQYSLPVVSSGQSVLDEDALYERPVQLSFDPMFLAQLAKASKFGATEVDFGLIPPGKAEGSPDGLFYTIARAPSGMTAEMRYPQDLTGVPAEQMVSAYPLRILKKVAAIASITLYCRVRFGTNTPLEVEWRLIRKMGDQFREVGDAVFSIGHVGTKRISSEPVVDPLQGRLPIEAGAKGASGFAQEVAKFIESKGVAVEAGRGMPATKEITEAAEALSDVMEREGITITSRPDEALEVEGQPVDGESDEDA